ncbi:hypothetical protein [Undibacterium umbellatum]|uniref:Cytochrome c family protein n=1 Tax=Undibacterium umbellatum TaxID=2762300 RepID=A0ABR6Z432_9BURK|nr:hypothetical protein [Undibacterium umbellatum]MBC3906547.1 hypothetical protein [Undibacterium umbellatum]
MKKIIPQCRLSASLISSISSAAVIAIAAIGIITALPSIALAQQSPASSTSTISCNASSTWVSNPSLPGDVQNTDNCSFQQYMWQAMLYLVQPVATGSKVLQFKTFMPSYGIFVDPGKTPTAWGKVPKPTYCKGPSTLKQSLKQNYVFSNLTLQAGVGQPLIDKSLNRVFYGVSVNKPSYDFITGCGLYQAQCSLTLAPDLVDPPGYKVVDIPGLYPDLEFPTGAMQLKTAWKILTPDEMAGKTFYSTKGSVKSPDKNCMENVDLGLVGMHIVSKTPTQPEFIWGTFEHRNNAPYCSTTDAKPPLGGNWTFYNPNCTGGNCTPNHYAEGKATQVCTMHPWGDPTIGTMPNNLNCSSTPPPGYICDPDTQKFVIQPSTANLQALDISVQKMLAALPAGDANKLWANYSLVGNVWTARGTLPPSMQVQVGSLSGSNNSMETYVQNGVSNIQNPYNCFSCHNQDGKSKGQSLSEAIKVQLPPAGLSHIFNLLNLKTKGCSTGVLPSNAMCAANGGPRK